MSGILLTAYSGAILGPIAKVLGWVMNGLYMAMYNLFGIEDSDLDATMRVISAILSGFVSAEPTGIAAIFDLVNSIIYTVKGDNPKRWLATFLYKVVMGFDSPATVALEQAQQDFGNKMDAFNAQTGAAYSPAEYEQATDKSFISGDYWVEGMAANC